MAGDWRRLHNEELHNFNESPNIRVIKSRKIKWAGLVADMGGCEKCIQNLRWKTSKDHDVDGRTILEWILGKQGGKVWTGCIWLRIGSGGGFL
jgi:hypothetical protein